MGDLINFPHSSDLAPGVVEDLWMQLEIAERRVEDIKRQLGVVATENGID